jgi:hypothetical protein
VVVPLLTGCSGANVARPFSYDKRQPSDAQLDAVAALAAHLAKAHDVSVQDIRGHRDYAPGGTSCPGSNLYRYLEDGDLQQRIETNLGQQE